VAQALPSNVDGQYQTPYDYKGKIGQRKAVKGKRAERQCIQNNSIHSFTHCLLRAIVFTFFQKKKAPGIAEKVRCSANSKDQSNRRKPLPDYAVWLISRLARRDTLS
jgi:hypothetical protein